MDWSVDPDAERPPSRQLMELVLNGLSRGALVAGDQLPSVRSLASEAMVNHNTVARAWRDLEQLGVAEGRNGRGVFVTQEGPRIAREQRRESTLEAFHRAAREALRAGHSTADLQSLLNDSKWRRTA